MVKYLREAAVLVFDRYYRSEAGTTGSRSVLPIWAETSRSSLKTPRVVRYRSTTGTTDPRTGTTGPGWDFSVFAENSQSSAVPVWDRYYRSEIGTTGRRDTCSESNFWISNRLDPKSVLGYLLTWETRRISLGVVSYWDKTTSLYKYERIMADWVSIYQSNNQTTNPFYPNLLSTPLLAVRLFSRWDLSAILGGLAGPRRSLTCILLTDLSGGCSEAYPAEIRAPHRP